MGKRKRVKKMQNLEESSASFSSSSSSSSNILNRGQIETSQEPASSSSSTKDQGVKITSMADLPPEMLLEILKCVDTRSLFQCRLASRQWDAAAVEILSTRGDTTLHFVRSLLSSMTVTEAASVLSIEMNDKGILTLSRKEQNATLEQFVDCMKSSRNCPFARFSFQVECLSFFEEGDWTEFLSICDKKGPKNLQQNQTQNSGIKIKSLDLEVCNIFSKTSFQLVVGELRDLLVNKIPHLEQLALDLTFDNDDERDMKLFPPPQIKRGKGKVAPVSVPVQLPNLKVVGFQTGMILKFPGIVRDLLNAAVNLKSICLKYPSFSSFLDEEEAPVEIFQFLNSLGKLHLVKKGRIEMDDDFINALKSSTGVKQSSDFSLAFQLRELKLYTFASDYAEDNENDHTSRALATNFMSNILESSKNTLRQLKMHPLGFLTCLQFPKFQKLNTLKLREPNEDQTDDISDCRQPFFPPEIRSEDIFPAVRVLDFKITDWSSAFPREDSVPRLPNVKTLCLVDLGQEFTGNSISILALMCPNLKQFQIKKGLWQNSQQFNFLHVGSSIWTHMKQLESLELDLELDKPENGFPALDSCFTGISPGNCQRLYELMAAGKLIKNRGSQEWISLESGAKSEAEKERMTKRENAAISEMKNLKTLKMNLYSGGEFLPGKRFFRKNLTWLSEEFAFKFMPRLKFNARS